MRIDRNRRYRERQVHVGPPTVIKEVAADDSCCIYFWNMQDFADLPNANFPDPFGINGYHIPYSMNKKKRWTIPKRLRKEIEDVQDPETNLRVSASTHSLDRADHRGLKKMTEDLKNRPTLSYHTVSRDGQTVTNIYAKNGPARMQTLIKPKGMPPMETQDKWVRGGGDGGGSGKGKGVKRSTRPRWRRYERWERGDEYLVREEEEEHQKLHVMYTSVELTAKATAYNKLSWEKEQSNKKKGGTVALKHIDWLAELPTEFEEEADEDRYWKEVAEEEEELYWECDEEEEYDDVSISPFAQSAAASLDAFLVAPFRAHPRPQRRKREPFKDESFSSSSLSLISRETTVESSSEEEEEELEEAFEDVVIIESPSNIVLVTALPQLYTKIRLSDTALESLPPLPVYPRTWIVHRESTAQVLGRAFPICIVAKELTEREIGLFGHDNCLSCAYRWGRFRILFEGADADGMMRHTPQLACSTCIICCRDMIVDSVFEHERPFSLACGHMCCTGCWLQTISEGIKRDRLPVACPEPSCPLTFCVPAASALLDSVSLRNYTDAVIEALLRQQKIVCCRNCSRLHRVVSSRPSIRCACGTSICALCSSVAHAPISCKLFKDYCSYMNEIGHSSTHVTLADPHVVYNQTRCPKCWLLGEPMHEGCTNVMCLCGQRFCHTCGVRCTRTTHVNCEAHRYYSCVTLIDVSSLVHSTALTRSIEARISYNERRTDVLNRLMCLSIKSRKEFDKAFSSLYLLMEICYLNSRKSRRSRVLADRIQFAMSYFFNTEDRNRRNLLHKTERLRKILNDISTELYGVSDVQMQKKLHNNCNRLM